MPVSISVIITTRNRAAFLQDTLRALIPLLQKTALSVELLVVDNGSTDNTRAVTETECGSLQMWRYIYEERPGQCHARNRGVTESGGDAILFVDDDVHPPHGWLEAMTAPILQENYLAVAGGVTLAPHLLRPWMDAIHRAFLAETTKANPHSGQTLVGANMAFAATAFKIVPGFDVELGPGRLGFGDDSLFDLQMRETGGKMRFLEGETSFVEHHFDPQRLTRAAFLSHAERHGRSWGYIQRHWEHTPVSPTLLRIKKLRKQVLLRLWRQRNPERVAQPEGMHEVEMDHLRGVHHYDQWLKELKRPPNYERHGLVKRAL